MPHHGEVANAEAQPLVFPEPIPLSLYIHFPWCVRKCPYCDFNSHAVKEEGIPEQAYIAALLSDLEEELPRVWGRRVSSIFLGGGTPSLFSPDGLDQLLSGVRARIPLLAEAEVTLEANPGTVEQGKFSEFRAIGLNRLSLGIQSFDDSMLQRLGRIHTGAESHRAIEIAQQAGFDNLNLDLMFGLPGQTLAEAVHDIDQLIVHKPAHISYYQLTLEPNTLFYTAPPKLPEDEFCWEMQQMGQARLASAGYEQYEVSAYAQSGRQCQHNRNYWTFGDYLGIGAGAHGKVTDRGQQSIVRRHKQRHPQQYLSMDPRVQGETVLMPEDLPFEFMLNAMRLSQGFPKSLFSERTGRALESIETMIQTLVDDGLMVVSEQDYCPTDLGRRFLNSVIERFLPDATD